MKKILIVDDHSDIRRLIRMSLEFEDYDVREAATGETALLMALEWQPDLVLLDVMMPGHIDGLEVCRCLRAEAAGQARPRIIMLSARGQACDREAGLRAGADAYFVKPFSPLQLIDRIADLWAVV
ncbi:response regulator transcription factor [Roseateles sp. LYH14W]|uniref:Response regulator transcription factor n=1 Tax=Pelomonas parva TaxID=3299032 RepID=A0ABW7FBF8_9BURK